MPPGAEEEFSLEAMRLLYKLKDDGMPSTIFLAPTTSDNIDDPTGEGCILLTTNPALAKLLLQIYYKCCPSGVEQRKFISIEEG